MKKENKIEMSLADKLLGLMWACENCGAVYATRKSCDAHEQKCEV